MASVTLALSPLSWENIDLKFPTEPFHICMNSLAWVRKIFVEYGSNMPYNLIAAFLVLA